MRLTSASDALHSPLLSQADILDLHDRVHRDAPMPDHRYDVAHRKLGDARSIYRGQGMDYDESRPYLPGDELRFMNWRVTARTGVPHMKVFREERKPGVFMVIDRRGSMRFGTRTRLKVTQAVRASAWLAFDARLRNAPVGAVILDSDLKWEAESSDEQGVYKLIEAANTPCPPISAEDSEPELAQVIKQLAVMLTQGSHVVLISDFHDIDDSCRTALLELSMEHQLLAIHITDAAELNLPDAGRLVLQGKADRMVSVDSSDPASRAQYEQSAENIMASRKQLFSGLGIPYKTLMTHDDDPGGVLRFV